MLAQPKQKIKHERKCIACGIKKERSAFLRILCNQAGKYIVKPEPKDFGRSFYVCPTQSCLTKASKHKHYKNKIDFQSLIEAEERVDKK